MTIQNFCPGATMPCVQMHAPVCTPQAFAQGSFMVQGLHEATQANSNHWNMCRHVHVMR